MKAIYLSSLIAGLLFLPISCVNVIPDSTHVEPTNYLLTETETDLPPPDADFINGAFFYVRPVELAPYLGSSRLVYRSSANMVTFSDTHRWGEPLEEGIGRVIGKNLSGLLGTLNYSAYPNRKKPRNDFEVGLSIERFERIAGNKVLFQGTWQLFMDDKLLKVGTLDESLSTNPFAKGSSRQEEVAALSKLLRKISERMATEIVRQLDER